MMDALHKGTFQLRAGGKIDFAEREGWTKLAGNRSEIFSRCLGWLASHSPAGGTTDRTPGVGVVYINMSTGLCHFWYETFLPLDGPPCKVERAF
jgi:hypothetical protein